MGPLTNLLGNICKLDCTFCGVPNLVRFFNVSISYIQVHRHPVDCKTQQTVRPTQAGSVQVRHFRDVNIGKIQIYHHPLQQRQTHMDSSPLSLTRPLPRKEIWANLLLRRHQLAVTAVEFKTVNTEVMGFEPTVISSLAVAISRDISR